MERPYLALLSLLTASCAINVVAQSSTPPQVYNNYSFIPPGAPNHVVAQGSIIAIKNSIGPADFSPLQNTPTAGYGGVTINVTVNGTTTQVLNYYVGPQLAGVLPSNTPTGTGTYTVTYNGQTTSPAPITVVQNSFGVLSINSSGQGTAKVCDYNFDKTCLTFASYDHPAKPGDVITIWGSGLGPTQNDAVSVDMTKTVPVEVWIGGQQATVTYAARSQFVGLDLINTSIPTNVQGCYVSVIVKIGDNVSNQTSLPVEPDGSPCTDPVNGITGTDLANLLTKPTFTSGAVSLSHTTNAQGTSEAADATFYKVQTAELVNFQQAFPLASPGSCTVWTLNVDQSGKPIGITLPTPLDAGTVTVTANGTTKTLTKGTSGTYSADLGSGGFLTGTVTANGSGGTDVGTFNASITANSGFTWTNSAAVSTIVRANGQEIDWSGAAPDSYVTMSGASVSFDLTTLSGTASFFTCIAPGNGPGASSFTIPSSVLLGIAPSSTLVPGSGTLSVSNSVTPVKFTATGLDYGFLEMAVTSSKSVTYQ